MANQLARKAILLSVLSACGGQAKEQPVTQVPGQQPPAAAAPSAAAHEAAVAEVARLEAKADQDPLLAAWTGPYGGVPPWDKVKVEAFPAAF